MMVHACDLSYMESLSRKTVIQDGLRIKNTVKDKAILQNSQYFFLAEEKRMNFSPSLVYGSLLIWGGVECGEGQKPFFSLKSKHIRLEMAFTNLSDLDSLKPKQVRFAG
jgi:hypothetical protein